VALPAAAAEEEEVEWGFEVGFVIDEEVEGGCRAKEGL